MSLKRITKGNWKHRRTAQGYDIENDDKVIAEVRYRDEEAKSNAKVLCAARDMAIVLTDILGDEHLTKTMGSVKRTRARQALKKAGVL